jgi:hypothetical protein
LTEDLCVYLDSNVDDDPVAKLWETLNNCNDLKSQLNALHNSSVLKTVLQRKESSTSLGESRDAEKDLEILRLKGELDECRDDLKRDEEIFAEKIKDLKRLKKESKKLTTENVSIKMALQSAHAALTIETERIMSLQQELQRIKHESSNPQIAKENFLSASDVEPADLNISNAVAASEPELSQLMEDLEVLSREKEELLVEKEKTESKAREVQQLANQEKEQFMKSKDLLQRRLKELEIGMKLKQVAVFIVILHFSNILKSVL